MQKNSVADSLASKESYIPFIDGLRGVAVLMVIISHTSQHLGYGAFKFAASNYYVQAGDRGVQLFFLLSAFTLFNSSFNRFRSDQYPALSFYIRRVFRILPFWIAIVLLWTISMHHSLYQAVLSITFLFGFLRFDGAKEIVPGGWTLFVEETFYLLLPILFLWVRNVRRALWLFIMLLGASYAWMILAPKIPIFNQNNFIFFAPPTHWFAFGLGIVAYYLVSSSTFRVVSRNRANHGILNVCALALAAIMLPSDLRLATFALFGVILVSAFDGGLLRKISTNKLLMRMGRYCYSIYLLQFFVLILFDKVNARIFSVVGLAGHSYEMRMLLAVPLILGVLMLMAKASFVLIERPCVRLGRKIAIWVNGKTLPLPKSLPEFIWSPKN